MANPATAFSLYDPSMTEGMATPAERLPEGGLPPMNAPVNPLGPLQAQVLQTIMSQLSAQPEKGAGGFLDYLTGYKKLGRYQQGQERAQMGLQAVNAMTGMENARWKEDTSARGWANIAARVGALDQAGQRIDLSQRRFQWQQLGYQEHFDEEFDPRSGTNRNVVMAIARDPATGNIVVRDKVYFGQAPVGLQAVVGSGGQMQQFPTSPMGGGQIAPQAPAAPSGGGGAAATQSTPKSGAGGLPFVQPPPGVTQSANQKLGFIQSLNPDTILRLHGIARESVKKGPIGALGPVGQAASDWAAGGQYTRALVGDPEVAFKQAMKWSVYQYVKAQTGAQFSITEMDRYAGQFPTLLDDPERARFLLNSAIYQAIRDIRNMQMQWGGLRAPNYTPEMQAADDNAPPEFDLIYGTKFGGGPSDADLLGILKDVQGGGTTNAPK